MKHQHLFVLVFSFLLLGCERTSLEDLILPKQLTSTNLDHRGFLSPDGNHIVFSTSRNTHNPYAAEVVMELWIMNCNGSDQRPLLEYNELHEATSIKCFMWSPDSKSIIVFISAREVNYDSEVWKIKINGKKIKILTSDYSLGRLSCSPDGSRLAFLRQGPNPAEGSPVYRLYCANLDFSDTIQVEKGLIGDYDWVHNSELFVYSLYDRENQNYDLWKSSLNGTSKTRLSETPEDEEILSCSYDGLSIAYSDYKQVYITPVDTFIAKSVQDNASSPQWIPYNNLILFYSHHSDGEMYWTESWIIDTSGIVVDKIEKGGCAQATFSYYGDYILYNVEGNLWIDSFTF